MIFIEDKIMGIRYSEYVVAKYNSDDELVCKSMRSYTLDPARARRFRFAHHAKDRCDFLNRYYEKYATSDGEKFYVFERIVTAVDVEFVAPPTKDELQKQAQDLTNTINDLRRKISELEAGYATSPEFPQR